MTRIFDQFSLDGRVALVTGGAGLLGAEFCRTLAEAGAAVVVVDWNADGAARVADSLTQSGQRALAIPADITRPESVAALVEQALAALGHIDILVNSAALDPKFDPEPAHGRSPALSEEALTSLLCSSCVWRPNGESSYHDAHI